MTAKPCWAETCQGSRNSTRFGGFDRCAKESFTLRHIIDPTASVSPTPTALCIHSFVVLLYPQSTTHNQIQNISPYTSRNLLHPSSCTQLNCKAQSTLKRPQTPSVVLGLPSIETPNEYLRLQSRRYLHFESRGVCMHH